MSEKMSEEEKSVSKIIKSNFKDTPNNILVMNFMNKVYKNEIKIGDTIATLDEAKDWCLKRHLNIDNDFRTFLLYWTVSYNSRCANQIVIGSWFNCSKALGDNIKYFVLQYYNKNKVNN